MLPEKTGLQRLHTSANLEEARPKPTNLTLGERPISSNWVYQVVNLTVCFLSDHRLILEKNHVQGKGFKRSC